MARHRKSSTGCWTCRARKVRCDETKPVCRQCQRHGRECGGYQVRLRWVDGSDIAAAEIDKESMRSHVALSPRDPLPCARVDEILEILDADAEGVGVGDSLSLSGFGVFSHGRASVPAGWESSPLLDIHSPLPVPLPPIVFPDGHGPRTEQDINPLALSPITYSSPNTPAGAPLYLTPTERFLLNHYSNRVMHLFCVIDNEKSPWKTIHLPKALQTAGELSLTGSTSTIRRALLSALLSVSAFCLFNYQRSRLRRDESAMWKRTAEELRCTAIELLKDAVDGLSFDTRPRYKYKDFLATMLSMVTINVISGDIETCGVHLDGALRFINHARSWKTTYSTKARALHRQYLYLRTIYESTLPRDRSANHSEDVFCRDLLRDLDQPQPRNSPVTVCETVYGVPFALLDLLMQTIELINRLYTSLETQVYKQNAMRWNLQS